MSDTSLSILAIIIATISIILVAARTNLTGPLQYTPLGTHAAAIERARTQDKEP